MNNLKKEESENALLVMFLKGAYKKNESGKYSDVVKNLLRKLNNQQRDFLSEDDYLLEIIEKYLLQDIDFTVYADGKKNTIGGSPEWQAEQQTKAEKRILKGTSTDIYIELKNYLGEKRAAEYSFMKSNISFGMTLKSRLVTYQKILEIKKTKANGRTNYEIKLKKMSK